MPDDGLAVAADQAMQDSSITDEQPTSFFDYGEGDDRVSFENGDELKSYIDKRGMQESDYTQKTQTLAEDRRRFLSEQDEYRRRTAQEDEVTKKLRERYEKHDAAMKRRPNIAKQLDDLASQPSSPDEGFQRATGYVDEKYQELEKRLSSFEDSRKREQLEHQRDEVYTRLQGKYTDFDKEAVNKVLDTLEEGNLEPLLDIAFRASRYAQEPGVEERVVEKLQRKQAAKLPTGGGAPKSPSPASLDPKAAYDAAMSEYVGESS
jgi:hypothetical protein